MLIIKTSKGLMNAEAITRTAAGMDNGQQTVSFFTTDGGRVILPLAEGQRLAEWLEERAVLDTTDLFRKTERGDSVK